jgi:hypothetical protein
MKRHLLLVVLIALLIRAYLVSISCVCADILSFHIWASMLQAGKRLYSQVPCNYPPLSVWFSWLVFVYSGGPSFAVWMRIPMVLADCVTVAMLFTIAPWMAWAYALNPVSLLLILHGQMDPIMVASTLGAILLMPSLWSAVVLSIGIGLKSYPILLLPLFLLRVPGLTRKVFYAALATAPLLTLVPYWRQDAAAVRTFVLRYPGVIDQGWAAFFRYSPPNWWQWVWPNHDLGNTAVFNSKQWFWYPYAALLIWDAVTVLYGYANRLSAMVAGVYLLFYVVLGTISVQHLLWALPFFLIVWPRFALIYTVIATTTMFGEYTALNLAGIMYPGPFARFRPSGNWFQFYRWATGVCWMVCAGWLLSRVIPRGVKKTA